MVKNSLLIEKSFVQFITCIWFLKRIGRGTGNNYCTCSPLSPANEYSFNSSRCLPLIFTRSLCNYQADSWWDMFFLEICILFSLLWMKLSRVTDFDISKWHCEELSSYQTINFLLQKEHLNKLRYTPLPTTVYLSNLPSPIPSHNLSSNRFPKCIRNKACFIF